MDFFVCETVAKRNSLEKIGPRATAVQREKIKLKKLKPLFETTVKRNSQNVTGKL